MKLIRQQLIQSFDIIYAHLYNIISYEFANNRNLCWIIGFFMVAVSLWIRSTMYLGTDPAFYYLTAERILHGQRYYYDFFESNFPLNFYIYTIPVILHEITGLGAIPSFYAFITFIAFISIYFSSLILKKTSVYKDGIFYNLIIIGFFFGHFFPINTLNFNEIGTKTVLFLSFILPYFCSFFLEAENKKLPTHINIIIGIFAGMAVCLKPNYVFFPIVMELYLLIKNRHFKYLLRPMNYSIVAVNIIHLAWLVIFVPEYIFKLFPLIAASYYGISPDFISQMLKIIIIKQLALIIIFIVTLSKETKSEPNKILLYGIIATSIILGTEGLCSYDQSSILGFFDGLLLIKIIIDVFRNNLAFNFFKKLLLTAASIIIITAICINFVPTENVNTLSIKEIISTNNKLSNKGPVIILARHNLTPVSFYIKNEYIHNISSLAFIQGAQNNQILYESQPTSYKYKLAVEAEKYIVDSQIKEITQYRPKLIFIENLVPHLYGSCFLSYIEYFQQYEGFRKIFRDYELYEHKIITDPTAKENEANKIVNDISVYVRKYQGDRQSEAQPKFQGIFY